MSFFFFQKYFCKLKDCVFFWNRSRAFIKKMIIFLCGCNTSFSKRKNIYIEYGVCYLFMNIFFNIINFVCFSITASTRLSKKNKKCVRINPNSLQIKILGLKPPRIQKKIKGFVFLFLLFFILFYQMIMIGIGVFGSSTKVCLCMFFLKMKKVFQLMIMFIGSMIKKKIGKRKNLGGKKMEGKIIEKLEKKEGKKSDNKRK
ncbi:hypothetical protein RFI_36620 [Reticulomyxa filosa]|uniref:Uncharacterized protein n=1 Tax=Reticulomyxa filosa TaxID=46433 RepID=X6LGV9_RETFI|nr:hypothetical protein RFI_36620 [Reticulomyxa filosa]|eukprot:ETO00819.1 hypothetical protein RFI_36620 [Reticulomyxa filosa]